AATPVPQLLVVCPKATLSVTTADKTITAGTTTPAFTYAITGYKKSETASVVTGTPVFQSLATSLSAGSYPIVINQGTLAATNYEFQMTDGTLTVSPGTATPLINAEDSVINIFPNPTTDFITVENAENEVISIFDLMGKMVLNTKSDDISVRLDVSKLAVGTYILKTTKNNALNNKKLLIIR
ncbi:MAG: T9SS type A sorting domain-containing protein, partial [Paludibacter sp.]